MLTLARVENGGSAPGPPPVADFAQCLLKAVAELETLAELRRVRVDIQIPPGEPVTVPLSAEDCSLLVSNLLLNALQHSPPDSTVQARITFQQRFGSAAKFSLKDHGEGIDSEALPHVFERFFRGDPSRDRATGGAGLGLAICKAIVERATGSIEISSEPGQGTNVTVRLPLAQTESAKPAFASA
jgi:signal transduction histidine kinase